MRQFKFVVTKRRISQLLTKEIHVARMTKPRTNNPNL